MGEEPDYELLLAVALDEARLGLAEGGIPIGAALFDRTGKLLGRGHNRRVQENDPSVHGETDAFRKAGRQRRYQDTIMVTTLAPCWYCSGLIVQFQIGQVVRQDGPASHKPKAGTPTMGGLLILVAVFVPTLLWADLRNVYIWIAVISTALFASVGFVDDYLKITRHSHYGLFARYKFASQILIAVGEDPRLLGVQNVVGNRRDARNLSGLRTQGPERMKRRHGVRIMS